MASGAAILLVVLLAYATVADLRYRRIPNRLTLPVLVGGLVLRAVGGGQTGLLVGLGGAGLALAMMLGPFVLNWIGAGDVKLAMAVGALMGPDFALAALLFAALVAGAIAVAEILRRRQLATTARYLFFTLQFPIQPGMAIKGRLPYAPATAVGCALAALSFNFGS